MVLKSDQERVRKLIKDTLTLLCKNGLSFDMEFSIEALIGVTLDKNDVFLVNINEQVKSEKAKLAEAEAEERSEAASEGDSGSESGGKRRRSSGAQRKKRRKLVKSEYGENGGDSSDDDANGTFSHAEDSNSNVPESQERNQRSNIKEEAPEDGDDDNVIIIKEEMEDSWQGDQDSFGQFSNLPGTSQDQNFPSLSDMSLMPVGPQDASQVWAQSAAYASPGAMGRVRAPMNTSSGQIDPSQESQRVILFESVPSVRVDRRKLAAEENMARFKANPGSFLMYRLICMVIPPEQLIQYSGLGTRITKAGARSQRIPEHIMAACFGFVQIWCERHGFPVPITKEITRTVRSAIDNAKASYYRRHPHLKPTNLPKSTDDTENSSETK